MPSNNNKILISIIIPFFNVQKFIGQCLDSVFNQDMPEELYEVICVNDDSPDNSREIVLKFKKKHSNLILLEHEFNKKLGPARNTGRSASRGKYIWNVDSDDMIQPNILSKIINQCESNKLDILIFNFDHLRKEEQKLNSAYPFINSEVLNGVDFIKKYCLSNFGEISPIWTQVYNREFLDKYEIFSPPINMGEDVPFTLKSLLLAERIKSITDSCYVYRANELSLTGAIKTSPNALKIYENCFVCSKYVFDILKFIPKKEVIIYSAFIDIVKHILLQFTTIINNINIEENIILKRIIRKNFIKNFWLLKIANNKFRFVYMKYIVKCKSHL
jgi:glycosyltransferase involved in cell wall biosynthesis